MDKAPQQSLLLVQEAAESLSREASEMAARQQALNDERMSRDRELEQRLASLVQSQRHFQDERRKQAALFDEASLCLVS